MRLALLVVPLLGAHVLALSLSRKPTDKDDKKKMAKRKWESDIKSYNKQRAAKASHERETPEKCTPPANATYHMNCPQMPVCSADWETSYLNAVFIDGKDAMSDKGPHVFDWDYSFFWRVSDLLTKIYADESQEVGKQELSIELVEKFRKASYEQIHDGRQMYTPPRDQAAIGIMPQCTDQMECKDVKELLQGIPPELYTTGKSKAVSSPDCPRGLKAETQTTKRPLLIKMVETYNKANRETMGRGGDKEELLNNLVGFVRSFGFLHGFEGGNGRLRNMLLQRELRRLNIACGAMMYNFNKDVFVEGFPRYLAKIKDGIEKFDMAIKTKKNPWTDPEIVAEHNKKFGALSGLEQCSQKSKFGSGGNIALERETEVE